MGLSPLSSTTTSDLHVSIEKRTSTEVSFGFVLVEDRSSPFGSYRTYSPTGNRVSEEPSRQGAVEWGYHYPVDGDRFRYAGALGLRQPLGTRTLKGTLSFGTTFGLTL